MGRKFSFIFMLIFFLLSGCSLILPERRHSTEMNKETDGLWVPKRDFKVMSGDTGKTYRTRREIFERTPATSKLKERFQEEVLLDKELSSLEGRQTDEGYNHYMKYYEQLENVSERIFFLRMKTVQERNEFLYNKGLFHGGPGRNPSEAAAIRNRDVLLGMSKDAVTHSWGRPSRIDIAGNPRFQNERWAYFKNGKIQYVYFEGGLVNGWDLGKYK